MSIPEIRKRIKTVLKEKGLHYPSQDGSYLFMYKELKLNRFTLINGLVSLPDGVRADFSATFVPNRIGDALNYITQEKRRVFSSFNNPTKKWNFRSFEKMDIDSITKSIIDEAEDWIKSTSYNESFNYYLTTLEGAGSHQLWHLAALAVEEDLVTLAEYLELYNGNGRNKFLPYIKYEHIDRAIDFHYVHPAKTNT